MPSPVGHALVGGAIALGMVPRHNAGRLRVALAAAMVAIVPDVDFLPVLFADVERGLAHRGMTHSLGAALLVAMLMFGVLRRSDIRVPAAISLAFASHGILDALTTLDGNGVALLWPITDARWKLGWFDLPGIDLHPDSLPALIGSLLAASVIETLIFAPLLAVVYAVRLLATRFERSCSPT